MDMAGQAVRSGVAGLARLAVGAYFSRVQRFHPERVPATGPVLLVANHPGSVADALVLSVGVRRPVHFVATVQLFRWPWLAWVLHQCGIIPVNRLKDDPRAMRSVLATFEACYAVLEPGGAVGIFPEGITYEDSQLKPVKTGAARMALELERRHEGRLGLWVLPVGLTYSAKERYRSEVLVHFGEPLRVADFLGSDAADRKHSIVRLSGAIEGRIQQLILHVPEREQARLVDAVHQLYSDRLRVGRRVVGEPLEGPAQALVEAQRIAEVVAWTREAAPRRYARFQSDLAIYERLRKRLRVSEEMFSSVTGRRGRAGPIIGRALLAVAGAPVAVYGGLHRFLPVSLVAWAVQRFAAADRKKSQTPIVSMVAGTVAFGLSYALYVGVVHAIWGWPASFWYALSLPVSGLATHYYTRSLRELRDAVRVVRVLLRAPWLGRRLLRLRWRLVTQIDRVRQQQGRAGDGPESTPSIRRE